MTPHIAVTDLDAAADDLLTTARAASSGRATTMLCAPEGQHMSQVLLALADGRELSEHENPGQATLQVLRGSVVLRAGAAEWHLSPREHMVIPPVRHSLFANEDAVVILTMVKG